MFHVEPEIGGRVPNSLARNIDDDGQSTFRTLFLDKVVGQELGNRGSQVNTVDKDVD